MASILGFSTPLFCKSISPSLSCSSSPKITVHLRNHGGGVALDNPIVSVQKKFRRDRKFVPCSVSEETQVPEEAAEAEASVVVPVSPSDVLTMFFQADGMMNEALIPAISGALQETDGISNLEVKVVEGIASIELKKQTTLQATGVASSLVEIIQGKGFKLQTLNLSFEDEDVVA
ncbi:uncharacterized protein LOC124913854 [Impatiens glandulifera]|uniref:uncharacterized protein LOC124913854 n=1 Tax=Impatiens glandulifera TaxID=253017 RepID=UPI001FB100F1|nr:uncharacterized protein LOC124913854 [Impatiens glandulifera]